MRLPTLRRNRAAEPGIVTGTARLDRRTKRLVGRLRQTDSNAASWPRATLNRFMAMNMEVSFDV